MSQALSSQRSWIARIAVLGMLASLLAFGAAPAGAAIDTSTSCPASIPAAGFTDLAGVPAAAVDAINCVADYGISTGTTATTFDPFATVERWQMALFLTRQAAVHGVTLPSGADQGFTDLGGVPAAAVTAINQTAQLGISTGTSATTFDPFGTVERWQMALFLTRLITGAGLTLPAGADQGFTDLAGVPAAAVTAINQLGELDISDGTTATTFDPFGAVERWAMALFLTRVLAADGITPTPVVTLGETDAPQLLSATFDDDDADQTRIVYKFDQDVSLTGGTGDFVLVDPSGEAWDADDVDKFSDDEIEAIFDNDYVDVATVAAVRRGAVENIDGDPNPAAAAPWEAFTVDGLDLPGNDAPEMVALGDFDDDDDTVEIEFDQDMDAAGITETGFLFVEEGGNVWIGVAGTATTDDEIVTIEIEDESDGSAPDQADVDDLVRVFLEPGAVSTDDGNVPHSLDLALNGETDDTPSLEGVDINRADKEVTFTFNRSIVDEAFDVNDFVLVTVAPGGAQSLVFPAAAGDLDRDTATTIVWDTDDGGAAEQAMARIIVFAGVWDDGAGGTLTDFSTGNDLEVGHFVQIETAFPAGATAAPRVVTSAGSSSGLAGDEYDIVLELSLDMDAPGVVDENQVFLFETNGDEIDPTFDSTDTDDEEVTLTLVDGDTGFDELDDGDVGVFSFDEGFAESQGGYISHPQSIGCGC